MVMQLVIGCAQMRFHATNHYEFSKHTSVMKGKHFALVTDAG